MLEHPTKNCSSKTFHHQMVVEKCLNTTDPRLAVFEPSCSTLPSSTQQPDGNGTERDPRDHNKRYKRDLKHGLQLISSTILEAQLFSLSAIGHKYHLQVPICA